MKIVVVLLLDRLIIAATNCSIMLSSNSINKAKTGTEVGSLGRSFGIRRHCLAAFLFLRSKKVALSAALGCLQILPFYVNYFANTNPI